MMKILAKPFRMFWGWFGKQSRKKKIGIIVAIFITGTIAANQSRNGKGSQYELTKPEQGSIVEYVTETGNVIASDAVPVYSTTNGVITELFVENDIIVNKGKELLTVQSTATEAEKQTARAAYLTAKSTLQGAQATMYSLQATMFDKWNTFHNFTEGDKYKDVTSTNRTLPEFHISEKEWLAAEANYKNQQTVVSQSQANLSAKLFAYQATQDSTVTAPSDGVVQNVSVVTNQTVQASTPGTTIQPVLMLRQFSSTIIRVTINETDINKVTKYLPVILTIDGVKGKTFQGIVERVDAIGTNNQGVVTYNVYIRKTDDYSSGVRAGMTANVDIEVAKKDNILTVPSSAVKPYQGGRAIRILDKKGEIEYIPVEIGIQGDGKTEIVSGIDENTEIIEALKNDQVERRSSGPFGG